MKSNAPFFKNWDSLSCKAEQSLWGMELQKEKNKYKSFVKYRLKTI